MYKHLGSSSLSLGVNHTLSHVDERIWQNYPPGQQARSLSIYGQTGTGKTYTLMGALERVARDLGDDVHVAVEFFEIHGGGRGVCKLCDPLA